MLLRNIPCVLNKGDKKQHMQSAHPNSILVVDDHDVNRKIMAILLGRLGYRCVLAENGEQALQFLKEQPFDLVLMDCLMPGMSGMQTTCHLKESGTCLNRDVPVIAVTANVTAQNREECKQAGMDGFLEKPINIKALKSVLDSFLTVTHR